MSNHTGAAVGAGAPLQVECRDGVARVVIDRPEARNALNLELCEALRTAFEALDADEEVLVVLLSANGPSFCAGADMKERDGRGSEWVRQRRIASFAAYAAIERCSKPVVALVNGPVVGSGGEIAMSCDFAIASSDVSFRFPEPHLGTIGATQRLQRVIGRHRAKELLLTAREMPVEEAHRAGLVVAVVEPEQLVARGDEIAAQIAKAPAQAMTLTKQAMDLGGEVDLQRGIRIEMMAVERRLAETIGDE